MDPRLQRRIQRYGWDLAADDYEPMWLSQVAPSHAAMLEAVALAPGERVLDVAAGPGAVAFAAAAQVAPGGRVLGVDLSGEMVARAARRAAGWDAGAPSFHRMDAEALALDAASFDVALCALGLMYMPEPEQALAEMRRVLRPGGRVGLVIWGERRRCAWSSVFEIVDAEVASEVCPLFFRLGGGEALAEACRAAGFVDVRSRRLSVALNYPTAEAASAAAFVGGPVALAWSRFDAAARARTQARYVESIAAHRGPQGYALPGEFVIVHGRRPG